ncbi:1-acyl-sn-glycerol-3-phosphate acyltransferase [Candidatus Daviesbacteria bacterium]|nr:1-acyl-sn-glycerol-3-phosphate acyltransferase [Candidatus Daviesbacteria bacterium]
MGERLNPTSKQPNPNLDKPAQKIMKGVLGAYMSFYHKLEVDFDPSLPKKGPAIALTSHFSLLDTIASMVADPYHNPTTTMVVKESMGKIPVVGWMLNQWGAIYVNRNGQDLAAVRRILDELRHGRTICIAPEGTRSRSGRLGSMNQTLVLLAIEASRQGTPSFPLVQIGTYEALPPGAILPKPEKIIVKTGPNLDLSPWHDLRKQRRSLSEEEYLKQLSQPALLIQTSIADLLPENRRPFPKTPPLKY